ncbi:MAG: YdcF family protein [Deltaproteobacteria bacterium]|nr:YdcF family protein [Deltaproteobacteria bacterium]
MKRWLKWTGLSAAGVLVLAVVTMFGANACIKSRAAGYVFSTLAELPPRTHAIVLGARVNRDGRPSQALADRIDCAYDLWSAGRVHEIFVSGDGEQHEVMAQALIARGVPAARIARDGAGHRTRATMMNAHARGIRDAIVCTQGYHQARSVAWARHLDIDAVGWVSDRRPYSHRPKDDVREALARTLAMLEIWFD